MIHKMIVPSCFVHFRSIFFHTKLRWHSSTMNHLNDLISKAVLNEENRRKCITKLQSLRPLRVKQDVHAKQAAVLVPFCMVNQEISLLYTLRSSALKSYSGQVSFPGGMQDEADSDLEETACRETCEEIGLKRNDIDIWGHGNFVGTKGNEVIVLPYLGYIGDINVSELKINRTEVESVFTVPLKVLCDPRNFDSVKYPAGYTLPEFTGSEHKIWGMTAIVTHIVLKALLPDLYRNELPMTSRL